MFSIECLLSILKCESCSFEALNLHFPDPELNILREELHDSVSSADGHDVNIPEENMLMQGRR